MTKRENETAKESPLAVVLGQRLRAIREANGQRQDDVAAAARQLGLAWKNVTVATVELGRRQLGLEEFLLLPFILHHAGLHRLPEQAATQEERVIELADLFPAHATMMLTPRTRIGGALLSLLLQGQAGEATAAHIHRNRRAALPTLHRYGGGVQQIRQHIWPQVSGETFATVLIDASGDAEQKAARKWAVPPAAVSLAARKVWGHSLTAERDRRIAGAATAGMTPRTRQALRGHITRALLADLHPLVEGLRGLTLPEGKPLDEESADFRLLLERVPRDLLSKAKSKPQRKEL